MHKLLTKKYGKLNYVARQHNAYFLNSATACLHPHCDIFVQFPMFSF